MNLTIRSETLADYTAIAEVNMLAFGHRPAEALFVALHRQRAEFDPDLSLVAEHAGEVAGHVLFSPRRVLLGGQAVPAVNLTPIAIHPARQRQGIGAALVEQGHARARAKGYAFSYLRGHVAYYPRFGYRTRAYGSAEIRVPISDLGQVEPGTSVRPPLPEDEPALRELWQATEGRVDFALPPDAGLLAWLSPNPTIQARVYAQGERLLGYARYDAAQPAQVRFFLAADAAAARQVAACLAAGLPAATHELRLPLHPASPLALGLGGSAKVEAWESCMACQLAPSPLDDYLPAVAAGRRPPGRVIWPVEFDL